MKSKNRFFLFIFFFVFFPLQSDEYMSVSHSPGIYNNDISLTIVPSEPDINIFFRFMVEDLENEGYQGYGPWIPVTEPVPLSAVVGEEICYTMILCAYKDKKKIEERTLEYVIDKKRPFPPLLTMPPGEYQKEISLLFLYKDKSREKGKIIYSINSIVLETGRTWNEKAFVLSGEYGRKKEYTIQAYSVDAARNRSDIITYHYTINMNIEAAETPRMTVKSPVSGSFENKQLLYIESYNCREITYTVDGTDPGVSGILYTGPVLLEATGNIVVKVVALPRLADSLPVRTEVSFSVNPAGKKEITVNKESGLYYSDTKVMLAADPGTIFNYTLEEHSPSETDEVSRGEIVLKGEENEAVYFPLRVRTVSKGVKLGKEYRFFYFINKKKPVITRINVFTPGGPESTYADVEINGTERADIHYTLDGSIPDRYSPLYSEKIRIRRQDAYPDGFILINAIAFGPYGEKSDMKQRKVSFLFGYPDTPVLEATASRKTNNPVTIFTGKHDNIVFEISANGIEPPDPSRESEKAYEDLVFSLPPGLEKRYMVKCAAADKDLFTISPPVRFEFTIDRMPPPNPEVLGIPESGFTSESVTFSFKETPWPVYFQLTDDGSEPLLQGSNSPLYKKPVTLHPIKNREITFRINALSIDDLENISFSLQETIFKIDQKVPDPPGAPLVKIYEQEPGERYTISWDKPVEEEIYYTLSNGGKQRDEFLLYKDPFIVDFSKEISPIMLKGFIRDFAGNKSEVASYKLFPPRELMKAPSVTGVVDGDHYNRDVTIELKAGGGMIHYELTDDGTNPKNITKASSQYTNPLTISIADGESKEYCLRASVIEKELWNVSSHELYIRFILDKKAPESPRIQGIKDSGYYDKRTVASFYNTEDTIYYELIPAHKYSSILVPQEFIVYNKEIVLDTEPGTLQHYILIAFSVDKAGNLSKERPEWRITVDKNSIFVSPLGRDTNTGTQKDPLATINKALEYSLQSSRKRIVLAHGVYKIMKSLEIRDDMNIIGGFDPRTWESGESDETSVIDSSDLYISGGYPFVQEGGNLSFQDMEFRDSSRVFTGFIKNTGGTLTLTDVTILQENPGALSSITAKSGIIEIHDSTFSGKKSENGTFIFTEKSNLFINSSDFTGPGDGNEFTVFRIKQNPECMFQNVTIHPGHTRITRGADIEDSFVLMNNCRINTGQGKDNAVGMRVKNSVVNFQLGIIHCNDNAKYAIGISSENSKLTIDGSLMNISGQSGATGIRVKDGLINMFLSTVKSNSTHDFLYLFDLENEKGSFVGNLITGMDAGDTVCGILNNSETYWINNTIISGTSAADTSAFIINGDLTPHFINNIIARPGKPAGTAFHFIGGAAITSSISNNNLSGWENLLKIDYIKGKTGSYTYTSSQVLYKSTASALNQFDGDSYGGNIRGNFTEDIRKTFQDPDKGNYHLLSTSACVNNGMDVRNYIFSGIVMDFDGEKRPAETGDLNPLFDIGADEYYGE